MKSINGSESVFIRKASGDTSRLKKVTIKDFVDPLYRSKETGLKDVSNVETVGFNFNTRAPETTPILSVGRYHWDMKMRRIALPAPYKSITLTPNHTVFAITPDGVFPLRCDRVIKSQTILVVDDVNEDRLEDAHPGAVAVKEAIFTKRIPIVYDIITAHENVILGNRVVVSSS